MFQSILRHIPHTVAHWLLNGVNRSAALVKCEDGGRLERLKPGNVHM